MPLPTRLRSVLSPPLTPRLHRQLAANPRWQPWIPLRRVADRGVSAEEKSTKDSDAGRDRTRQLQAPPARAVTRSGRASRPPLRYGLMGDVEDWSFHEVRILSFDIERRATSVLRHRPGVRFNAPFVSRHHPPLSLSLFRFEKPPAPSRLDNVTTSEDLFSGALPPPIGSLCVQPRPFGAGLFGRLCSESANI